MAALQRWEIVGGADKGGVIVRDSVDLKSPQGSDRLSTGAIVEELELVGERLHYRRIGGTGPSEGWISISLKDKVLACRVAAAAVDEVVLSAQEPCAEELPCPELAPDGVAELSDEASDRQSELVQQAAEAVQEGQHEQALQHLCEAVALGCARSPLYTKRAEVLLRLGRPRGAISDCTAALGINPDFGKAYKLRARANSSLKRWKNAHSDFQQGLAIDHDDDTYEESLVVAAKMKEMQAVATARRVKEEDAESQRKQREAQAAQNERLRAQELEREKAAEKAKVEEEKQAAIARIAREPYYLLAKKQGYMSDFMGQKRGKCKCNKCDFYVWRPVRLNS